MKLYCLLILLGSGLHAAAQTYATTDDGRRVVLNDDSTWRYTIGVETVSDDTASVRSVFTPTSSKTMQSSARNKFSVWYNEKKWKPFEKQISPLAEFTFVNSGQFTEAFAMIVTERVQTNFDVLKDQVLKTSRLNLENFKLITKEYITVNNHKVLHMIFGGNIKQIDFIYDGYYATGPSGVIQVVCFTTKNLFATYEKDFDDLLNGLTENL